MSISPALRATDIAVFERLLRDASTSVERYLRGDEEAIPRVMMLVQNVDAQYLRHIRPLLREDR